jgi:hypothetical protein
MELKDYIKVYDGTVDDNFCRNAIRLFEESTNKVYPIEVADKIQCSAMNLTEEAEKNNITEFITLQNAIVQPIVDAGIQYYTDVQCDKYWPSKNALEQIKMVRYSAKKGDYFDLHIDIGDLESSRRFMAYHIYLSDVETGGEMEFPLASVKITPKRGRIVMHPSTWQYPSIEHKSTSQDLYKLTTYLHYQ